mmetsp:Transcript_35792/g.36256  ORF Transcript_35792/g.36256 Transcript_35792/m.36256 type:complete len:424 (+) Transcript_35792:76-1347(+)
MSIRMMNRINEQKRIVTSQNIASLECQQWESDDDDDDNSSSSSSSSNIGADESVFVMTSQRRQESQENNSNNVDCIKLLTQEASPQRESFTEKQRRKEIDAMIERVTQFRQHIRLAINRSFDCDIIPINNDNEHNTDEAMAIYLYAFIASVAADETPNNTEPLLLVHFERSYSMDDNFQWEKTKKKSYYGNVNNDGTDTDTDTDTDTTEIIFDAFSDEESSNDYDSCFFEKHGAEQHFVDDDDDDHDHEVVVDADDDDDDDDDDFIIQGIVDDDDENNDSNNDSSLSMIDNLIDQFEFDLMELQHDISIHFDSFSTARPCQQEQEQQHHYEHHPHYHPCKRIMTKEECEVLLPVQQPVRIDKKKGGHNKNNTNVLVVVSTRKNDDAMNNSTHIIIPHNNSSSAFSKYLSYSKFFIHQKWYIIR